MRSDEVIADRYRLVEPVGSSGVDTAWLAEDLRDRRQVVLRRPHTTAPGARAGLDRAAAAAKRVVHPNAVAAFGVVCDIDMCWLVMAHFPGATLAAKGVLPPRAVAAVGAQVAGALAAAHAVGVIHRDVAPTTVLVDDSGIAKLTDFGVLPSRATTAYRAPEVAEGTRPSAASDVFSLGATLFAAVAGEPPFGTDDPTEHLRRVRAGHAAVPSTAGPLRPVLTALLQRDPAARPTAAQARELLDRVAAGQSVPVWRTASRWRTAVLATAAAMAAAVVLVLTLVRPSGEDGGPAHTALGDPRGADPCSVADAGVLGRFGEARLAGDHGAFNRCDVLIAVAGDDEIDVVFQFATGVPAVPPSGTPRVVRHAPERDAGRCDIMLTLADRGALEVTATSSDDIRTDFCQVAAVAADHAEDVLRQLEQVPRRQDLDRRSLANVDACALIDVATLATEPAFAGARPAPGFAGWTCRWQSEAGTVRVQFDRADPEVARVGTRVEVAGREVYVEQEGHGAFTCTAKILHLRYHDDDGDQFVELAQVVVEGGTTMAELCRLASTFATPVAAHVPSLSG